jgi:aerobic carbon-monoxide dehydrogenase large subunit
MSQRLDTTIGHVGRPVLRLEDPGLLTGADRFTADFRVPGTLHVAFVRSAVAHAVIDSIELADAVAGAGVVAVITAPDLEIGRICFPAFTATLPDPVHRPAIASGTVRFAGEILAVVVATSPAQALDAADLVVVAATPLETVVDPLDATLAGAPLLFPDLGSNVVVDGMLEAGVGSPSESDDVTVHVRMAHPRMSSAPMEGNGILAIPDPAAGTVCAYISSQYPHLVRDLTASFVGMAADDLRMIGPAVGGGFGGKVPCEAEYAIIVAVARLLGQPVRWIQSRTECLHSMQARGHRFEVELTAGRDGRFKRLAVDALSDLGAYPGLGLVMMANTQLLATGPYRIGQLTYHRRGVATNTTPIVPFRGAGRPEATSILERSIDVLAAELGIDPVELRRRNLIDAAEFPVQTLTGAVYDSGDYSAALDAALDLVGYDRLRTEQRARIERGDTVVLGIGVSCYVELSAVSGMNAEYASVEVLEDGRVRVVVGTFAHGQGHRTVFAQIVADELGVEPAVVDVVQGDTAIVPRGMGSAGSRSAQVGGSAVKVAAERVVDKARRLAAHTLEAAVEDVELVPGGGFAVRGVPASLISWAQLSALACDDSVLPRGMAPRLFEAPGFEQAITGTAPFGCHVAVAEVDVETGAARLIRHVAVDDCGRVLNPMLAAGQVHGGIAAGAGQALFEQIVHDEDGNLVTSTFAEYLLPSAAELPSFETAHTVTPSPHNPLGAKGLGEGGTTGSLAAVHNAVVDAVRHLGVRHIDLPLSPMRVWQAIRDAAAARPM